MLHHTGGTLMQRESEQRAALSPSHTFVVQFYTGVQVEAGRVAGRVEHLVSRQATTFPSLDALLAFIAQILREVHQEGDTAWEEPV
jgi:hypothetical protein